MFALICKLAEMIISPVDSSSSSSWHLFLVLTPTHGLLVINACSFGVFGAHPDSLANCLVISLDLTCFHHHHIITALVVVVDTQQHCTLAHCDAINRTCTSGTSLPCTAQHLYLVESRLQIPIILVFQANFRKVSAQNKISAKFFLVMGTCPMGVAQ